MMTDDATAEPTSEQPDELAALKARVTTLEADLEKERDQATEYMKRWQYAQAEIANMRRRHQQEHEDLSKYAVAPLAGALLEVLDNFDRAEQTIPPALQSFTWIGGVLIIRRQMEYLLQQHGLERVVTEQQSYDPALHEAIAQEHHDNIPEGSIIAEVQRGYKLHSRLLRPALVRVSQGPPPTPEKAPDAAEADQAATAGGGTDAHDG